MSYRADKLGDGWTDGQTQATTMPRVKSLLTLKHRETHERVVSTVATDALVLKHQAISIHNAD